MDARELNVQKAKLAEQTERYEDMRDAMNEIVNSDGNLTSEERNLLSVAYKNVCGARRSAYRIIKSIIADPSTSSPEKKEQANSMKMKIKDELVEICEEVLDLIKQKCLAVENADHEHKTFFYKMQGDYYRYCVEVAESDTPEGQELVEKAKNGYEEATKAAQALPPTNPLKLGLALNYSVFFYEIENNVDGACNLAKSAFDDAISQPDANNEDSYRDSKLILQLLRDNLTLWTADSGQNDDNDE